MEFQVLDGVFDLEEMSCLINSGKYGGALRIAASRGWLIHFYYCPFANRFR